MRIGLVSYEYPPQAGLGGVGTYMFRLASALGRAGHEVHVICGPATGETAALPNVIVHRVEATYDLRHPSRLVRFAFWKLLAGPLARANPTVWHWLRWVLASHEAIDRISRQFPFDVVEAPEHAAAGWMAGEIHRWPILLRLHCPWELFVRINRIPFDLTHRLLAHLERRTVARYADAITAPSHAMRKEVERSWTLRRPVRVIPNFMDVPADAAPLPPDEGPQRIVCTGRMEPLKGQDTLARAFAIVAHKHPRAELHLVGPDQWPEGQSFAQLLVKLVPDERVRARIHLPGPRPLEEVGQRLREARLACVSSVGFESFSYSACEAMAAARPVVVSDVGALPELIEHERCGLVVPPRDPHPLASAIDRLLSDRELSDSLRLAAHARAKERYDAPVVLPQIIAAYHEARDYYWNDWPMPQLAPPSSFGRLAMP
jgi:glycogen synthase